MTERTTLPARSADNDAYHTAPFQTPGRISAIVLPPAIVASRWFWAGPARLSA